MLTGTVCAFNQLAVSKQCWEAADIPKCITCMTELLEVTQSAHLPTALDLLTRFLRENARLSPGVVDTEPC